MLFSLFALLLFAGCATDGTNAESKQLQVSAPVGITEQDNALSHDGPVENCTEVLVSTPKKPFQENLDSALEFCQASNDYWERGDLENAIDALDQAYSLILKIDSSEAAPEILQEKEDLRFTISKRIAEVYASRFTVANGDHKAIPLEREGARIFPECLPSLRAIPAGHCKGTERSGPARRAIMASTH